MHNFFPTLIRPVSVPHKNVWGTQILNIHRDVPQTYTKLYMKDIDVYVNSKPIICVMAPEKPQGRKKKNAAVHFCRI